MPIFAVVVDVVVTVVVAAAVDVAAVTGNFECNAEKVRRGQICFSLFFR